MKIVNCLAAFLRSESGAVTADWIMLTALVVGLVAALLLSLGGSTVDYSVIVSDTFTTRGISGH